MNDNILTNVDMRLDSGASERTPEGALIRGSPPLLDCGAGLNRVVFMRRVLAIAREYVKDYDLVRAVARSGMGWEHAEFLERDPTFIVAVDMIRQELTPDEIATRAELMDMLKREATTAAKSRDRITAIKELARIAGFTLDDNSSGRGGAPVINITLNGGTDSRPPTINVTPAPPRITAGEDNIL